MEVYCETDEKRKDNGAEMDTAISAGKEKKESNKVVPADQNWLVVMKPMPPNSRILTS